MLEPIKLLLGFQANRVTHNTLRGKIKFTLKMNIYGTN